MPQINYYTVDVFTNERFGGNQLAIIPDATKIPGTLLQIIAREFNFSETTFVYPPENHSNDCKVRIFTPEVEVPMAGHPTIGTAYVLLLKGLVTPKNPGYLMLEEEVGDIRVDFIKENSTYHSITMSQPLPEFGPVENDYKLLAGILSLNSEVINQQYPIQSVSCGNNFLYVPLRNLAAMEKIVVRKELLMVSQNQLDSTNIFVFTNETVNSFCHFHCRMFAPISGISEDPATGSAAGPFGCYLVKNQISHEKQFILEQGMEIGRPSILKVNIEGDKDEIKSVKVSGNVVFVSEGKMYI